MQAIAEDRRQQHVNPEWNGFGAENIIDLTGSDQEDEESPRQHHGETEADPAWARRAAANTQPFLLDHADKLLQQDRNALRDILKNVKTHTNVDVPTFLNLIFEGWATNHIIEEVPKLDTRKAKDVQAKVGTWAVDCMAKRLRRKILRNPATPQPTVKPQRRASMGAYLKIYPGRFRLEFVAVCK